MDSDIGDQWSKGDGYTSALETRETEEVLFEAISRHEAEGEEENETRERYYRPILSCLRVMLLAY